MDLKQRKFVDENKKPSLTAIKTTLKDKKKLKIITSSSYLCSREALRKLQMQLETPICLRQGSKMV